MEELLSKIYDKVAFYEADGMQVSKDYDHVVEEVLKPLSESKTEEETEEIRELIYNASYSAEKCGFMLGVRFMATEPKLPQTGDNMNPWLYVGIGIAAIVAGVIVFKRKKSK